MAKKLPKFAENNTINLYNQEPRKATGGMNEKEVMLSHIIDC